MERGFSLIRKNGIWHATLRVSNTLCIKISDTDVSRLLRIAWKICIEQDKKFLSYYLYIEGIVL